MIKIFLIVFLVLFLIGSSYWHYYKNKFIADWLLENREEINYLYSRLIDLEERIEDLQSRISELESELGY